MKKFPKIISVILSFFIGMGIFDLISLIPFLSFLLIPLIFLLFFLYISGSFREKEKGVKGE